MKRASRCIAVFLAVILLMTSVPLANATVEPRSSSYFSQCRVFLSKTGTTSFDVWFDVIGIGRTVYELGASSIRIERSLDLNNWETVQRYSYSDYPNLVDYGTGCHGSSVSYSGTSGYYYRAVICLYCKNENGRGYSYQATDWLYM